MNSAKTKTYPVLVALVMVVFFAISFITNILNSIIVDVKDSFNLSLSGAALLPFSFFIAYGVMSIPAGFMADKYSDKYLLSLSFIVIVLASLGFALNPTYLAFVITLFVLGCAMAILQVVINPMLRAAGGEQHFAFNSVLAQLVFGLASFASPFLYIFMVTKKGVQDWLSFIPNDLPWVSLYVIFSLLGLLLLLIVRTLKYPNYKKSSQESAGNKASYFALLKNKWTLLYFLGIFCYVGTEQGIGNWISEFLFQYHGLDPQSVGANTVAYFWAMLTAGCLVGLLLLKLFDSRHVLIGASLLAIVCLFMALYGNAKLALLSFPAMGACVSVMWSIIFSLGLNSVKTNHGSLAGILCTGIAGGAVMPLIVGSIGDFSSLKVGMFFLIIPLFYILSIGFWAKPIVNNKRIKRNS